MSSQAERCDAQPPRVDARAGPFGGSPSPSCSPSWPRAAAAVTVQARPEVRAIAVTPTADSALVGQGRQFTAQVTADSGLATTVTWRT
jgi:uncharacterized protein YjdB